MLAELRPMSQITIPMEIIAKLGLSEGDKLDVSEQDGAIRLLPVAVYPEGYVEGLQAEVEAVKAKIASGEQPVFDSADAMLDRLEAE